jgi:soluble lytic murein transglycosylase-like protein
VKLFGRTHIIVNIKFLIPLGILLAVLLGLNLYHRVIPAIKDDALPDADAVLQPGSWSVPENAAYTAEILESMEKPDAILAYYRTEANRPEILAFFSALAQSEEVAEAILVNADAFEIPPALAFALCWGESRFNSHAVNRKNLNKSIDRGLFQLNGNSFPKLTEAEFFNPVINAYYGISHLRWCLDTGGSEVAGLAMYNAGTGRVNAGTTPKHTLAHISRVLDFRRGIEALFHDEYVQRIARSQREIVISKSPR